MSRDQSSFEALVDRHFAELFRFALILGCSRNQAADLVQQASFCRAVERTGPQSIKNGKLCLFACLYREYRNLESVCPWFDPSAISPADEGEQVPGRRPDVADLSPEEAYTALAGLRETYRAPLGLFYVAGCTATQIATILDIPVATAISRLARGKQLLRQRISIAGTNGSNVVPFAVSGGL